MMTIETRLARLERRHQVLQACCLLLILTVAGLALTAQVKTPPKEIAAQRFLLVDANGKTLGQWGNFGGKVGLSLWASGAPRLVLGVNDEIAALQMSSAGGMSSMLSATKEATGLGFNDRNGKTLALVGVDDAGKFSSGPSR